MAPRVTFLSFLSRFSLQELRKYKENEKDTEVLMSALSAMQDKTQHLENSLSAETRIKLDLFSALGDAKRQLEIAQGNRAFIPHRLGGNRGISWPPCRISALRGGLAFPARGMWSLNRLTSPPQPIKLTTDIKMGV